MEFKRILSFISGVLYNRSVTVQMSNSMFEEGPTFFIRLDSVSRYVLLEADCSFVISQSLSKRAKECTRL